MSQKPNKNSSADGGKMDKIVSLAKRRGFVFQSSEIYGGLNGCWDYGPLGVELLNNIKNSWWRRMTFRDDIEGIDASILMHPKVWEASGHVENFTDPMVDCRNCKTRYRLDALYELIPKKTKKLMEETARTMLDTEKERIDNFTIFAKALEAYPNVKFTLEEKYKLFRDLMNNPEFADSFSQSYFLDHPNQFLNMISCPNCGNKGTFTEARPFNLMFKTYLGATQPDVNETIGKMIEKMKSDMDKLIEKDVNMNVQELIAQMVSKVQKDVMSEVDKNVIYLRPETAQGIYVNFLNVKDSTRQKLPFGIAQIGKAFRNEINTKNFLFRTREFEQMEMQYFIHPGEDAKWFEYWKEQRIEWYYSLGMSKDKLNFVPHPADKLAHYAKAAVDIEYNFPFGWGELEGIHNRGDYDLSQHQKFSGKKLEYYDDQTKERFIPYVIETSAGASRSFMAFLVDAYDEDEAPTADGKVEKRTVLRLHPKLAPLKCAVFPLVNRDGLQEVAHKITDDLQNSFRVFYDEAGAVGRRYRRQDECGTPYCVTVDYDTLNDNTVTIRDRDSMKQERIGIDKIKMYVGERV